MNLKRIIFPVIIAFAVAAPAASDSPVYIERIEFKGIKNVDKYEIVRNSRAKVSEKGIIIDINSLKEVMNGSVMINNYDVDVENNTLIITVTEKYPLFMVLKVEKNISIPCLVDENRNVLESGRFFKTDMPIIIAEKEFFDNEKNNFYFKSLFDSLSWLLREKGDFAGELSEIEIRENMDLRIKLKSRKTGFIVKNDLKGFIKIEKSAAYLDAVNTYPEMLDLRDKRVLIGQ